MSFYLLGNLEYMLCTSLAFPMNLFLCLKYLNLNIFSWSMYSPFHLYLSMLSLLQDVSNGFSTVVNMKAQ